MKKGLIITVVVLIVVGLLWFTGEFIASGFDFSKLGNNKYVTNTYAADEDFDNIIIDTNVTDILFELSEDGKFGAVCANERDKMHHKVTVENGTLKITQSDDREWYDYISFFSKPMSMTVSLPEKHYESLKINASTGGVSIPGSFSFGSIDIRMSTGDVFCAASSDGGINIGTSTGDITLDGVRADSVELSVSTGEVKAGRIECGGLFSVVVSTGETKLTDVTCKDFASDGSTGFLTLKNVVATGSFNIERSTGDVKFDSCDACEINVKTTTGDVTGSFKSPKIIFADTKTGDVDVPHSTTGGTCDITSTTGDIELKIDK